jgi:hypothetical protein
MMIYGGSRGVTVLFLTLALDEDELSTSRPGRITPEERAACTHWMRGWVIPRAGLDAVEKREVSYPCRESNPGRPSHSTSLYRLRYPSFLIFGPEPGTLYSLTIALATGPRVQIMKLLVCSFLQSSVMSFLGRAIAQAVSRRVRAQVRSCGI